MTTEPDPYPELPALPIPVQLACASLEPEHLLLAVQRVVEEALNNSGDVKASD